MAKNKNFDVASDLSFSSKPDPEPVAGTEAVQTAEPAVAMAEEERPEASAPVSPVPPVHDKISKLRIPEKKTERHAILLTKSNSRDLFGEAKNLGISMNGLINMILDQRYGRL